MYLPYISLTTACVLHCSGRTVDEVWSRISDAEVPYDNLQLGQFLERIGVRSVEESLVPPGFAGSLAVQQPQGHQLPPPAPRHEVQPAEQSSI